MAASLYFRTRSRSPWKASSGRPSSPAATSQPADWVAKVTTPATTAGNATAARIAGAPPSSTLMCALEAQITASQGRSSTCSPTTFPLAGATDYPGSWEIWQHYYAQAYLLSRDYNVHRFSMFNEPNNWSGETEADWMLRLRVCSDAIQAAITDVNSAFGKSLVAQIYAPNTANGESKYNTATDTWGHDAVSNRHLKLNGTTDTNWLLFNFYNYQKYSMLTNDGGGLTGYIEDFDLLSSYIAADMPGETPFPLVLTEFNVRTGANYDSSSATQDDPTDSVALGANCVALTQRGANQLYLFKFAQTEDTTAAYGLAKNGTHYVDNISSACNYGGATRTAEVYRLFNKAAQGGRSRFTATASSGASSVKRRSMPLWV